MKVIIFEDNDKERNELKYILKNFFSHYSLNCSIIETTDPNVIFSNLDNTDLIFLDIEVNQYNGIEIGVKIRKINIDVIIILISSFSQYLIDGYKVKADRYFLKPLEKEKFRIEMKNVVSTYMLHYQNFFDPKISSDKIYYKDIIYIEFINRKSYLYCLNNKSYKSSYKLIYWKEKFVEQPFVQTHRAFIVNMNSISAYDAKSIFMINQAIIPLSRVYRKSFEKTYLEFIHSKT